MSHALVQLLEEVPHARVHRCAGRRRQLGRRDNLPAAPGRVDVADAADLARVVVLLGREVLPHEEVGLARVDGPAQLVERVEHHRVGEGLLLLLLIQPAVLVGEHEAHHVAAGADARDANPAALERVHRRDVRAVGARGDGPACVTPLNVVSQ